MIYIVMAGFGLTPQYRQGILSLQKHGGYKGCVTLMYELHPKLWMEGWPSKKGHDDHTL